VLISVLLPMALAALVFAPLTDRIVRLVGANAYLGADVIAAALQPSLHEGDVAALRARIEKLAADFPLYEGLEGW